MINNQKGSTLIMVLLVFSVISIMGVTLLARASYSINESKMEVDEQKAYYLAKSALNAAVNYFENNGEIAKDYIDKTSNKIENYDNQNNYLGQSYVDIKKISNSDSGKEQIKITAYGTYKDTQKSASAILEITSSNSIFNDNIIFGTQLLDMQQAPFIIEGDVVVYNDISINTIQNVEITGKLSSLNRAESLNIKNCKINEVEIEISDASKEWPTSSTIEESTIDILKIKREKGDIIIQQNWLGEVEVRGAKTFNINSNKKLQKLFVKSNLADSNINVNDNNGLEKAEIFSENSNLIAFQRNTNGVNKINEVWLGLNQEEYPSWRFTENAGPEELYIGKIKTLGDINSSSIIGTIYTNASNCLINGIKHDINQLVGNNRAERKGLLTEEMIQKIETQISNSISSNTSNEVDYLFNDRMEWHLTTDYKEELQVEGTETFYESNRCFTEYIDKSTKTRLVFLQKDEWLELRVGTGKSKYSMYYIDPSNTDTIIFIDHEESTTGGVMAYFNFTDEIENIYFYMPNSSYDNYSSPKSFKGAIIAKKINMARTQSYNHNYEFKPLGSRNDLGISTGKAFKLKGYQ